MAVLLEGAEHVFEREPAHQPTVAVGDQHFASAGLDHVVGHLLHADVGSIRRRARVHDLLDAPVRVGLQRFAAQVAENDTLVVDHDVQVVFDLQLADVLTRPAGRYVAVGDRADARFAGQFALTRQAAAQPVRFARRVPILVDKPEAFEPPRGP